MNINKPTGIKVGFGAMAVKGIIFCPLPGLFFIYKAPRVDTRGAY